MRAGRAGPGPDPGPSLLPGFRPGQDAVSSVVNGRQIQQVCVFLHFLNFASVFIAFTCERSYQEYSGIRGDVVEIMCVRRLSH